MKHIYEKDFRYVSSAATDLKETFRRERLRIKREAEQREKDAQEARNKTVTITRRSK